MVQNIAWAAVQDGATHPDLTTLAHLGTSGRHPNNMYKELTNKLMPSPVTCATSTITIWCKRLGKTPISVEQVILLPHNLFSCLYHCHRDVFNKQILGGGDHEVQRFWQAAEGNPYYDQHPVSARGNHRSRCVPLFLHGDGVSTSGCGRAWAKGVDAFSWGSMLAQTSNVITSMFLIFMLFGKLMVETGNMNTFKAFERKLAHSFYWLFLGKHPKRDEHDREYPRHSAEYKKATENNGWLADGYFAVLWKIRGDLEHMSSRWRFVSTSCTTAPCSCCRADDQDGGRPWTDGRLDLAKWIETIWDNASWAAAHPDRSHIFKVLPGLGIMSWMPDMMHCLHLGCYQYAFASLLKLLTHYTLPGSHDDNCEMVWREVKQYYKDILS